MVDLGLTSEQFFDLTPRQFEALYKRKQEQHERNEFLMGINTAVLANHSFNTPKKAFTPEDFMPSKLAERQARTPPKKQTRKQIAESIRVMARMIPEGLIVFKKHGEA